MVVLGEHVWREQQGESVPVPAAVLATQEARYRALVEAGALAIWCADSAGGLRDPGTWSALTGQPVGAARGQGWVEMLHPEDRAITVALWRHAIAAGTPYEAEYRLRHADGHWGWTAAHAAPVRDGDGRIREWVGVNTDIDARKQAEQALRASQARFRTLAEAMPHLVWQTDAMGMADYVNARWRAATGLSLTAMAEAGWISVLHAEDAATLGAAWRHAVASGAEVDADARLRMADGAFRWHRVRAAAVRDAEGRIRHWVGTCTDIEARRAAEDGLRQAIAEREALLREAEHRIKNSLQLVAALLRLQAARVEEPAARAALDAATHRVQAVAEAHRALQRSADLRHVRLAEMLADLVAGTSVQHPGADVRLEVPAAPIALDAERAIPLALALSELLAIALPAAAGPLVLAARVAEGRLRAGLEGAGDLTQGSDDTLGGTVIRALARQIGAALVADAGGTWLELELA